MQRIKYQRTMTTVHVDRPGSNHLQCRRIEDTTPCKGRKPKLWGFHNPKNAAPGTCIITKGGK